MEEQFIFKKKYKIVLFSLMGIGLLIAVLSIFIFKYSMAQLWSNFLLNNLYFLAIALFGGFFLAVHKIAWSGWHTALQKIPEALTSFIPIAAVLMFLVYFGMHDIYHWSDVASQDAIIQGKAAYLNIPFFFIRMAVYFAGWIALTYFMKKNSNLLNDSSDLKFHNKRKVFAGIFLVFFALTISSSSWDWIMSIDAHWFSTLFGWYVFIGTFELGIAFIIVLIWFLKRNGYLSFLNKEHLHDLGKYLFGFSIFWAYLWFSQYILIWYGHLPEETIYFIQRQEHFQILFFVNFGLNFIIPFFALMTTNSKRNINWLALIAGIVLIGHWIDYFLMIMPGAVGNEASIGVFEIALTLCYLGLFVFVVFKSLSKSALVYKQDPFMDESLHYKSF